MSRDAAGRSACATPGEVRFRFRNTRGGAETVVLDRFRFDGRAAAPQTRQLAPGVTEVTAQATAPGQWEFRVADDSSYYGFGERFDRLNQAHTILGNTSHNTPGPKGNHSYQPVPFFMSLRGYGLWLDTYGDATFDLNASDPALIRIQVCGARLRIVLIEGPSFALILDRFTALSGRQELPPYWAFAPWKARDYHRDQRDVYEDVDRYRELGLPASVILIDSPWATNYNTYEFNSRQFESPAKMVAHLHNRGYKLVLWHTSWINQKTAAPYEQGIGGKLPLDAAPNFSEAKDSGYFVKRPDGSTYIGQWWKGTGGLIDFTNAAARKWWEAQVGKAIAAGADGFKDDDAEGDFVGDVSFASGEDPRAIRNRYAVDYHRAVAEALRERKGNDWVLFQRSGTTGGAMLPFFWSGDNDATFSVENGLPTVVTAGLNAGMSGISLWMSDLGGYNKKVRTAGDDILFARWTEYSAFSPGMEVMSGMNLGPWDYGDEALRIFRQYSVLHMSLFPYRYAAAQESARNGLPMMRALVLMHQDDPQAREAESEYYFGPDLLVAPVVAPVTRRQVYLPEGRWVDYWSGKQSAGRRTVTVDAPLDRIPVWVRAGAIVPKIPEDVMTLVPETEYGDRSVKGMDDRRVYEIFPGGPVRGITDFEGRRVEPGEGPRSLAIRGKPARVTLRWRFGGPARVWVDEKAARVERSGGGAWVAFACAGECGVRWE